MESMNVLTVQKFAELFPAFSEATVRWWIFNAEQNGFDSCLIRIGGRVYIEHGLVIDWIKSQRVVPQNDDFVLDDT